MERLLRLSCSLSSHNRWAWVKSIPCFALFVSDLARSNSNVQPTGWPQKGIKKDLNPRVVRPYSGSGLHVARVRRGALRPQPNSDGWIEWVWCRREAIAADQEEK